LNGYVDFTVADLKHRRIQRNEKTKRREDIAFEEVSENATKPTFLKVDLFFRIEIIIE
jgi:hypothetical protein